MVAGCMSYGKCRLMVKPFLHTNRTAFAQMAEKGIWAVQLPAVFCPVLYFAVVMLVYPILGAAAEAHIASGFGVYVISSRPGHLFADSDLLDVRVQVSGAKTAVSVAYAVEESAGPWKDKGRLDVPIKEDGSG